MSIAESPEARRDAIEVVREPTAYVARIRCSRQLCSTSARFSPLRARIRKQCRARIVSIRAFLRACRLCSRQTSASRARKMTSEAKDEAFHRFLGGFREYSEISNVRIERALRAGVFRRRGFWHSDRAAVMFGPRNQFRLRLGGKSANKRADGGYPADRGDEHRLLQSGFHVLR